MPSSICSKGAIEQELDHLENMGVIEEACYSEWAAQKVPDIKLHNLMRVCGDYKVTLNAILEVDLHPLFVELSGGDKFSKLDFSRT